MGSALARHHSPLLSGRNKLADNYNDTFGLEWKAVRHGKYSNGSVCLGFEFKQQVYFCNILFVRVC